MEWVTTTTILEELRDYRNRDAWERLMRRFRIPTENFVREIGVRPSDCADVAQNTFLAFAESYRAGKYDRSRGRLGRWLFGIAYRQAMNQLRAGARHPIAPGDVAGEEPAPELDPAMATDVWDRIWDRHLLETAIAQARREFSPATFGAFRFVVLEDAAPPDAAARLGVPVKSVYNAKHRVLKRLRQLIASLEVAEDDDAVP